MFSSLKEYGIEVASVLYVEDMAASVLFSERVWDRSCECSLGRGYDGGIIAK